jgi:GAF domain-containing protein
METRSIVAVPVRFRDHCLGVIELLDSVGVAGLHDRDLALLEELAEIGVLDLIAFEI